MTSTDRVQAELQVCTALGVGGGDLCMQFPGIFTDFIYQVKDI